MGMGHCFVTSPNALVCRPNSVDEIEFLRAFVFQGQTSFVYLGLRDPDDDGALSKKHTSV